MVIIDYINTWVKVKTSNRFLNIVYRHVTNLCAAGQSSECHREFVPRVVSSKYFRIQ